MIQREEQTTLSVWSALCRRSNKGGLLSNT
jgi:hypothetical protein